MILKKHPANTGEYIVYCLINETYRSVGVFFGKSQARDYAIREYNDYNIEEVIE